MRFQYFGPASVRGIKVDWDIEGAASDEVVRALAPHDPAMLRPGRIRRGFMLRRQGGEFRASKHALIFAYGDDAGFLVEVDE